MTTRKIKIARISTVPFSCLQLRAQIVALTEGNYDVALISSDDEFTEEMKSMAPTKYIPVEIERDISLLKDMKAVLQLYRVFKREKFDITHSITPKAGLLCAVAGKLAGIRIRLHTFTGQRWVTLTGLKKNVTQWSDKIICLLNTRTYADSPSQRQFLLDSGITSSGRIHVIGSGSLGGVDTDRFHQDRFSAEEKANIRSDLNIPESAHVLLFVGRVTRDKGIYELFEAFQNICNQREDVFLLLVGPLETEDPRLQKIMNNKSISGKIRAVGFSNEPERYIAISEMLCLPSYREGFGTVALEAAAMGLPTVGTKINGLSDAVADGETGILVPTQDAESLQKAIMKLLEDSLLKDTLGGNARERTRNYFSCGRVCDLVIKDYESLMESTER